MSIILKGIDLPKEKDEALLLLILGDGTVAEKIDSDRYEEMTDTQAIQILKPHGRRGEDFIFKKLAEWFDPPCSYTFEGKDACDVMTEKDDGKWCNENCNDDYAKCWKRYFSILEAEEE